MWTFQQLLLCLFAFLTAAGILAAFSNNGRLLRTPTSSLSTLDKNVSTYVITYATPDFAQYADLLLQSAQSNASGKVITRLWTPHNLSATFKESHASILNRPRGAGYWIWKPYIIQQTLAEANEGDVVLYMDSRYLFLSDPIQYLRPHEDMKCVLRKPTEPLYYEHHWSKTDAYILMNATRSTTAYQAWAGLVAFRKTAFTIKFVDEWLRYCTDPRIVTDDVSVLGTEIPEFRENRHDQTVLSLLAQNLGVKCGDLPRRVIWGQHSHGDRLRQ